MHAAFDIVRQHLGTAAERRKDRYDLRVRPTRYPVGTWVYHFLPRRRTGRNRKWQRFYDGPFLVTRVTGPVNVELQRTPKSKPFVTHVDKLKLCHREGLRSWLITENLDIAPDSVGPIGVPDQISNTEGTDQRVPPAVIPVIPRPRRTIRRPTRYRDADN